MIATIVGAVTLVIGATTVFAELQSSLDRIWEVPSAEKTSGIWSVIRQRLLSFGMVLVLGSVLMAAAAVVVRLVRYRGARRRQMWWFLSGIAPLVVGLAFDPGSSPAGQTVAALVIFGALLGGMGWALLGTPARAVHDEETETLRVSLPTRFPAPSVTDT